MGSDDNTIVKNQLNQQITDKTAEINNCDSIKQKLVAEKKKLEKYKKQWNGQYQKHMNSKVASQVVVKNVFEGVIADKLKDCYGKQIDNMQKTQAAIDDLCKELDSQIRKLERYVTDLRQDITTAKNKLNGMED